MILTVTSSSFGCCEDALKPCVVSDLNFNCAVRYNNRNNNDNFYS